MSHVDSVMADGRLLGAHHVVCVLECQRQARLRLYRPRPIGKTAMDGNLVLGYCSYHVMMRLRTRECRDPGDSAIVRLSIGLDDGERCLS
jgi:hypothetical protein